MSSQISSSDACVLYNMQSDISHLLSSDISRSREEAVKALSERLRSQKTPSNTDIRGLSALLSAIYHHDPNASVRCTAISSAFCPSQAISKALFDSEPTVRTAALRRLRSRLLVPDGTNEFLSQLLALMSIESEDNVLLEALETLNLLLRDEKQPIAADQILAILGLQDAEEHSIEQALDHLESFGIVHNIAEHDSPVVRSAVCKVLMALLVRTWRSVNQRNELPGFDARVTACCFSILEELLQNNDTEVQMAAVKLSVAVPAMEGLTRRLRTLKLSEKSAKCLLRLLEPLIADNQTCDDNVMQILAALKSYPFATMSAYGLVETFLRRRLYAVRSARIQNQWKAIEQTGNHCDNTFDGSQLVSLLDLTLRQVIHANRDFARVFDLTRSLSDKQGHLQGMNG